MDTFGPMLNQNLPAIGAFHEAVELRPGLTADVAVPKGTGPHPVVVYLHGGGWIGGQSQNASQTWDAVRRSGIPDYQRRLSARARASVSGGARRQCVCGEVGRRKREAMERGRVAAGGRRRFGGRQSDGGDGHVDCGGELFRRATESGPVDLRGVRFSRGAEARGQPYSDRGHGEGVRWQGLSGESRGSSRQPASSGQAGRIAAELHHMRHRGHVAAGDAFDGGSAQARRYPARSCDLSKRCRTGFCRWTCCRDASRDSTRCSIFCGARFSAQPGSDRCGARRVHARS